MRSGLKSWSVGLCLVVAGGGNSVLAGGGTTAIMAVTPVNPPPGMAPYPPGVTIVLKMCNGLPANTACTGSGQGTCPLGQQCFTRNELRIDRNTTGGFRAWFNVQISDWDPMGDGPNLATYQVKIDEAGYYASDCIDAIPNNICQGGTRDGLPCPSGPNDCPLGSCGADIKPPRVACPGGDPTPCVTAFGEAWAPCGDAAPYVDICEPGYLDLGAGRPDSWCAPSGGSCQTGGVAIGTFNYNYFAVSDAIPGHPDQPGTCVGGTRPGQGCTTAAQCAGGGACTGPGLPNYYGGTLVLDLPAGAKGKYTVGLVHDETFVAEPGSPPIVLESLAENGFVVNYVTGSCCFGIGTPGAGCNDGTLLNEICLTRSDCNARPQPSVFTPGGTCPNPPAADGCPGGAICGDGDVNQPSEVCDGTDVSNCPSGGCRADCTCGPPPGCGDNIRQGVEECDGADRANCDGEWCLSNCTCNPPAGCDEELKLIAADALAGDNFGVSVSVDGDTSVVGANNDDLTGPDRADAGSAYVYVRNAAGQWNPQEKLTAGADAAVSDQFGVSVSISGDTAVVGARTDDHAGGTDAGSAYFFTRSLGVWLPPQKLIASDAQPSDRFGNSVSVSGDTAVVGAPRDNEAFNNSGAAYVFVRSAGVWSQQAKLTAPDAADDDFFGDSVSVDGDTILVGAYLEDHAGIVDAGAAYVFVRGQNGNNTWDNGFLDFQAKLTAESDAEAGDIFGTSVSVSGDTALVGVWLDDDACPANPDCDSGSAYVFVRIGGVWSRQAKLTTPDVVMGDGMGVSVSVSGDKAVVGADGDDDSGFGSGSAYVYVRTGGVWTQHERLTALDAGAGDYFGHSVSVSGDTAVVGAYLDDLTSPARSDAGSAYVFQCHPAAPGDDPSGINKVRFVSLCAPVAGENAIRVKLVSLHHVVPPYTGGPSPPFTSFEGQVRWVGPPTQYIESNANPTPFYASVLQCTPHYQDWSTVGLLHVTGSAVVPSSRYEVENLAASCEGVEAGCPAVSAPLEIRTTRWADVEQPYNPPSATIQPDLGDVGALVNKFRSAAGAPIKARALLAGEDAVGNINLVPDLNFGHIAACVDAFRGKPYPHTIAACP